MSVGVGTGTGCAAEVSTGVSVSVGGAVFFDLFFFGAVLAHSVLFRPVLAFVPFCFLEEVVVGVEAGSGEHGCSSSTKIGSPSSSNKFAVSISQAGYFLEGLL